MTARRLGVCALWLALVAGSAAAHKLSPAYFGLSETQPTVFAAQWKVSVSGGLADVLEPQIPAGCRIVGDVRRYVVDDAQVQHGTIRCPNGLRGARFTVEGLAQTATDVLLRVDYLDGTSFTHRLVPAAPSVVVPEVAGQLDVMRTYFALGTQHILFGVDHLLFVLALVLFVDGFGRLLATVTAFTVAHTLTLAAATLGWVHVPSAPVEALIALSILFAATELGRRRLAPPGRLPADLASRFPWLMAFSFGLLHGFGFAGALAEVGLPQAAIPLALFFFNVGVEAGQVIFIAAVLGSAWGLRRLAIPVPAWSRWIAVYGIGTLAAFWFWERSLAAI